MPTYRGGQRSARNAPRAVNPVQGFQRLDQALSARLRGWDQSINQAAAPLLRADQAVSARLRGWDQGINRAIGGLFGGAAAAGTAAAVSRPQGAARVGPQIRGSATYEQPGVGTFDRASGAMLLPAAPTSAPPGMGAPPVLTTSANDNRRAEINRMITQGGGQPLPPPVDLKPYWAQNPEIKRAAEEGPRSTEVGYSNRADIQEWMNAMNKTEDGRAMVNRFMEQQRKRGLIGEAETPAAVNAFNPMFASERLTAPAGDPALQARQDWADPALRGKSELEVAQAEVDAFQAAERSDRLNRVLNMDSAMASPPAMNSDFEAGYRQGPTSNWDAAANSTLNVPGMSGNVNQPATLAGGYGANPGVDWNAAMSADMQTPAVSGDMLTVGERYNDPDEQRRMAAGFLGNQIAGLKRYWRGAQ